MAPRGRAIASWHLVCASCSSWVQFDSSGCTNSWACDGCRAVASLIEGVEDLTQMMESMKRIVTGQGLEENREETGDRVAELGEADEKCEEAMTPDNNSTEENRKGNGTAGRNFSENSDTVIEIEIDNGTDGYSRQLMTRSGTQFLATHRYKKNPDSAVGNELDLNEVIQ